MASNDDDNQRPNPWGKPKNDRPNPFGNGPERRGPDDIDLDAILRKARANFDAMLPGQGPKIGKFITFGIIGLVVVWLVSGLYFVQPNQQGVVLTFGKYTRTDEVPGPRWRMPWPIQSVQIVDVTTERRIHIGYNEAGGSYARSTPLASHQESLMLTGDQNIVDINFVVLWRVGNARHFLYSIRDPQDTIAMVAASTMREIIGQKNIQPVLTGERTQIQADAKALMQKLLDEYNAGVIINNVQLQKVDPPAAVVDAFNEVQRARQKKEELKNLAEAYRNDIIPRAKGEAVKMIQDAEAYRQEVTNRAKGDADRFNSIYAAYKSAEDVTSRRMYIETMEQVLKNAKTIVLGEGGNNVTPYLPLNEIKRPAPAASAN